MCYILSIGLVCGYCAVLWRGFHPQTSIAYQLFYVDQLVERYSLDDSYTLEPGTCYSFDGHAEKEISGLKFLGRGEWVHWFDGYSTMAGNCSSIYFIRQTGTEMRVCVTIKGGDPIDHFKIQVDDVLVYDGPMICGDQVYEIAIPQGQAGELVKITFHLPEDLPGIAWLKELKLC